MPKDFQSILTSDVFRILVGPEKTLFLVHSELLVQASPVLAQFVRSSFKESTEMHATIDDVCPETFARATSYMYSGDYSEPEPSILPGSRSSTPPDEPCISKADQFGRIDEPEFCSDSGIGCLATDQAIAEVDAEDWFGPTEFMPGGVYGRDDLWEVFIDQWSFENWTRRAWKEKWATPMTWRPYRGSQHTIGLLPILLAHAELYVFASRYDMPNLGMLALRRLGATLCDFSVYVDPIERVQNITNLVEYTYNHTFDRKEGIDKLRNLVLSFTTAWLSNMMDFPEFNSVLEANGSLGRDICRCMMIIHG